MDFKLTSDFFPTGDQPGAIEQLTEGIKRNEHSQTLLGVTGSGKTFTMANVIQNLNRPTLILSHNKTLAAQLYGEFKQFFPENAVEYFVSYYDYYQPEAYMPVTNTYIEKDLSINEEIEKLRLSTTSSLLTGRKDIIVVSSVSCIYGIGNPEDFHKSVINIVKGQNLSRNKFLHQLVDSLYSRSESDFKRGNFRVRGDTVDVFLAYNDLGFRFLFLGDEIEEIHSFDPITGSKKGALDSAAIYPANLFVTTKDKIEAAIGQIKYDLDEHVDYLIDSSCIEEAERVKERVNYDIEMMKELGYCSGIENYSRYFDGRSPGDRPFCLLDYFPKDYISFIDESHATIPQIRGMFGGDRSRKENLVNYGFRLPAALDNRPLNFNEFDSLMNQVIYVSATPADYELEKSEGVIVEQLIRPTGLLDPEIEVRPSLNQIDDLMDEIAERIKKKERVLITTLTKRMAEELSKYLFNLDIKCRYIHSDIETLERVEILRDLRLGKFDVLVGINLLREGLDLPEVSLVTILDADKEGFLRSSRALTQTAGRAARHINGKVIMYADKETDSMKRTIDETNRRRAKQMAYNTKHGITPQQIKKTQEDILKQSSIVGAGEKIYAQEDIKNIALDPVVQYMNAEQLKKAVAKTKRSMEKAAKNLDFIEAAMLRDELYKLEDLLRELLKVNT
ncbi:MAG TPA: excinuclease ABC subunit UvrB [Flavobacteriales bacterium]|nr:excinuclease ABC subunit UvrB [Flavobacteriales bacterium]